MLAYAKMKRQGCLTFRISVNIKRRSDRVRRYLDRLNVFRKRYKRAGFRGDLNNSPRQKITRRRNDRGVAAGRQRKVTWGLARKILIVIHDNLRRRRTALKVNQRRHTS